MEAPDNASIAYGRMAGFHDSRSLEEKLLIEFSRAVRYRHPLSYLLLDLDLVGPTYESLGRKEEDEIVKEAMGLLLDSCRSSDVAARLGQEKFSILLPHTDYEEVFEFAERLRKRFAEHTFLPDSGKIFLTVSIGVSSFPGDVIEDRKDLLNFAEQALFLAKAAGRNQIALYRDRRPFVGETLPELKVNEEKIFKFQKKLSEIADEVRRTSLESSKALMETLEAEDPGTAGHAERTARFAKQIAQAMGLPVDEAEVIEHAALLHDIGKLCLSEQVARKPGEFTLAEYEAMKQHPYLGYRILKPIRHLQEEAILILHHHEWFDGKGYPSRLSGHEIPLGSRIIGVVDAYDTMRATVIRFKRSRSVEETVEELIRCAGTQFDPLVVEAFVRVLLMRNELAPDAYNKELLKRAVEGTSPH